MKVYRQGDVMIVEVKEIPKGLVKTKQCTLALGESSGHHHTVYQGAKGYSTKDEVSLVEYLEVEEMLANLTHQEHDTIPLPKGKYKVIQQKEYSPEEIRNVMD